MREVQGLAPIDMFDDKKDADLSECSNLFQPYQEGTAAFGMMNCYKGETMTDQSAWKRNRDYVLKHYDDTDIQRGYSAVEDAAKLEPVNSLKWLNTWKGIVLLAGLIIVEHYRGTAVALLVALFVFLYSCAVDFATHIERINNQLMYIADRLGPNFQDDEELCFHDGRAFITKYIEQNCFEAVSADKTVSLNWMLSQLLAQKLLRAGASKEEALERSLEWQQKNYKGESHPPVEATASGSGR